MVRFGDDFSIAGQISQRNENLLAGDDGEADAVEAGEGMGRLGLQIRFQREVVRFLQRFQ